MNLILLALILYLSSAQSYQCRERNTCQQSHLEAHTSEKLNTLNNLVKLHLASKISELSDYDAGNAMSNRVAEYLSGRLGMGLPELAELSYQFSRSMRSFLLTADRSGNDIQNQLIQHNSAVPLQELIRVLESEKESSRSAINREKLTVLINTIKNNKLCVRSFIKRSIKSTDRVAAARLYQRLLVLLRAVRALATRTEARLVIQSIREVLGRYRLGDSCRRAWTANIACRACNSSVTGGPLPRACKGLCASTLWVCLAPLLQALRGSNDVIRYKRALAEMLSTHSNSLSVAVPSIAAIADELQALTLNAIQRTRTMNLVKKLPRIAEACDFNADIPDSEIALNSTAISDVSSAGEDKNTDVDHGRDSRGNREVQQFSLPLPPQRLVPLFRSIIASLCNESSHTDRCWNGTQVAPFLHNTYTMDFSLDNVESIYSAAGVEWDREEFLAETAAISGATDPCTAIQGDSKVYYTVVSESQSACFEERQVLNASTHLTAYISLLTLAISLVLYLALV